MHEEYRSFSDLAICLDASAMRLNNTLGNRQP